MPAGLQIWNEHGVLVLDGTTRCARIKGIYRVGGFSESISVDLSDGTPFWAFQPDQLYFHISNQTVSPVFSANANGLSWTYSSTAGTQYAVAVKGTLIYGVF